MECQKQRSSIPRNPGKVISREGACFWNNLSPTRLPCDVRRLESKDTTVLKWGSGKTESASCSKAVFPQGELLHYFAEVLKKRVVRL